MKKSMKSIFQFKRMVLGFLLFVLPFFGSVSNLFGQINSSTEVENVIQKSAKHLVKYGAQVDLALKNLNFTPPNDISSAEWKKLPTVRKLK